MHGPMNVKFTGAVYVKVAFVLVRKYGSASNTLICTAIPIACHAFRHARKIAKSDY